MTQATIGARFQVVIPRREREKLGLKSHERVWIEARGNHLEIKPMKVADGRGLGRELRDGTDATDYVSRLRAEWVHPS